MFGTETSSSNAIRSVVPSAEIDDVRQRIETQQHYQSTIDIVEGGNSSVACALGQLAESKVENEFIFQEVSMVVKFSKTTAPTKSVEEVIIIHPVYCINESEMVDVENSSVSLEKPNRRNLLETHL